MKVIISAAGTGGHINPGIAIANKIKEEENKKEIIVKGKEEAKTYLVPYGAKLRVKEGDEIEPGAQLIEGSVNPSEILAINGAEGVYKYLTQEVQKVYRNQGVDINDKHIEVIARQMLKKIRIEDPGDTGLYGASLVDILDFEEILETMQTTIKIRIHKSIMDRVLDYCTYEHFSPDGDEYYMVDFPFVENEYYYDVLLGLGNKCECLEPLHIRAEMKRRIQDMAAIYEN